LSYKKQISRGYGILLAQPLKQKSNRRENGIERKGEKPRCIGGTPAEEAVGERPQASK